MTPSPRAGDFLNPYQSQGPKGRMSAPSHGKENKNSGKEKGKDAAKTKQTMLPTKINTNSIIL